VNNFILINLVTSSESPPPQPSYTTTSVKRRYKMDTSNKAACVNSYCFFDIFAVLGMLEVSSIIVLPLQPVACQEHLYLGNGDRIC